MNPHPPVLPRTVIARSRAWSQPRLAELWAYRELLYFLVWRDVKVRYKQTVLGAAWAIIQPVCTMIVFTLFFGWLAGVPSDGLPYPIFVFTALLPWQLFAHALAESTQSLVGSQQLVTKVYFPRLIAPLASVLGSAVDFAIGLGVLGLMFVYYGIVPSVNVLLIPVFAAFAMTTAFAVGLWGAALNVQYRDVRYVLPFLTQIWLLGTPIAYPSSIVPEVWRPLYALNPMVGVVDGFRWALMGHGGALGPAAPVSVVVTGALLVGGLSYFRRVERTMADIV
jgi:lipopolysaccharide transport system permease protein